jgi:hypothetical protein
VLFHSSILWKLCGPRVAVHLLRCLSSKVKIILMVVNGIINRSVSATTSLVCQMRLLEEKVFEVNL